MNFKKRVNGSWTDTSHYIHNTSTDTITTLPAVIYPTGTTATVGLKGQTTQSSIPSPTSPVMPQGTGERTGNLFDIENITHEVLRDDGTISYESAMNLSVLIRVDGDYTVSWNAARSGAYMRVSTYDDNKTFIARIVAQNTYTRSSYSNTHTGYIRINYENSYQLSDVQVNTGSTPLPYEPYGYKIPISSASTTTPVYLGEVETTRRIRKLVLDGTEQWQFFSDSTGAYGTWQFYVNNVVNGLLSSSACSNIADYGVTAITRSNYLYGVYLVTSGTGVAFQMVGAKDTFTNISSWKSYLAAQYQNGTPVTVWYVLAESETAVVNEPLMKIGDYADTLSHVSIPVTAGANTLSVDTTLQPSEVTVNYKGWHPVQSVHERESGAWT